MSSIRCLSGDFSRKFCNIYKYQYDDYIRDRGYFSGGQTDRTPINQADVFTDCGRKVRPTEENTSTRLRRRSLLVSHQRGHTMNNGHRRGENRFERDDAARFRWVRASLFAHRGYICC